MTIELNSNAKPVYHYTNNKIHYFTTFKPTKLKNEYSYTLGREYRVMR